MGWLTQLTVGGGYLVQVLPALVLIGFGLGTLSPVAANLATFQVPEREAGVASGVFNASEQIGASIGLAVLSTIAATSTDAHLAARPAAGQLTGVVHGYTVATTWAAVILAAGAVVVGALVNAHLGRPLPALQVNAQHPTSTPGPGPAQPAPGPSTTR